MVIGHGVGTAEETDVELDGRDPGVLRRDPSTHDAVISYLDQFPLEALPADAQRLLYLTLSLAEVGTAVELFKQPSVPDGYDAARFVATHNM